MEEENKINRSMGELLGDLSREVTQLARQEFEYARTELTQKVARISKDAILIGIGGSLAYAGLLCLLAAGVYALALVVPWWLGALIVAAVALFLGSLILAVGVYRLHKRNLAPRQTLVQIKEDKEWLTKQIT